MIANLKQKIFKLFSIITLFFILSFFSSSCCCLLSEYFNSIETSEEKTEIYDSIKAELSDPAGYYISPEAEEDFYDNIKDIYSGEKLDEIIDAMKKLKKLYPKGFSIVVKTATIDNFSWFKFIFDNPSIEIEAFQSVTDKCSDPSVLNTLVHEYTHTGSGYFPELFNRSEEGYVYLIGNFGAFIKKDVTLFEKPEIYQDIPNPDDFDSTYLSPGPGKSGVDFMNILDEVNAYTRSAETMIAFEELIGASRNDTRYGLLKQMSHLELYLKRAYEKHPKDWEYIVNHKGLSFLIMKLWQEASRFEKIIENDNRLNLNSEPVSEFVYSPDNYLIMEKLLNDSGIIQYKDMSFS
ncbi:MAG: hypothetical protein Q7J67_05350, partial [bacterium]|nr:hypothetical protein [bacterium]